MKTITIRHASGFHAEFPANFPGGLPKSIGIIQKDAEVPVVEDREGFELEKELTLTDAGGQVRKAMVKSNLWHRDKNGWWYWHGITKTWEELQTEGTAESPAPILASPERFDWCEKLAQSSLLPSEWWEGKGEGIHIAILDAGFNLQHPSLSHLQGKAKTYNMDQDHFRDGTPLDAAMVEGLNGDDELPRNRHGTACLSVLAAKHPSEELVGILPEAQYHLFNVYEYVKNRAGRVIPVQSPILMEAAMQVVAQMDVDIVSVSITYPTGRQIPASIVRQITRSKAIWFWALRNSPQDLSRLISDLSYSRHPFIPLAKVGVLDKTLLSVPDSLAVGAMEEAGIDFILPQSTIRVVQGSTKTHSKEELSCSFATPIVAGLAGRRLAHLRQNGVGGVVREAFIRELKQEACIFYKDYLLDDGDFALIRLLEQPLET